MVTSDLQVTLTGITGIESNSQWESTTSGFYGQVYEDSSDLYDVTVEVKITEVDTSAARRGRRRLSGSDGRALRADSKVVVTYTQTMSYRNRDPNLTNEQIVEMPLSTDAKRDEYIGELKQLEGYEDLTSVSEISFAPDDGNKGTGGGGNESGSSLPMGAIIGGACGGAALIILVVGFVYYKRRSRDDDDYVDPGATTTLSSTQGPTASGGAGTGSSLPTYGDQSVATMDYDYSRAFGGAGAHSLSDAGGTLGANTRQTAADAGPGGSGNTIFSDDPTFDQAYDDVREEIIDIYAPAGKLGVVIDTPDDGAPVVHAVKDTSPIANKVQVGDKLVAVDDEDVRAMTAIKVSKLISRKSNNASRKLTIIRHVSNR